MRFLLSISFILFQITLLAQEKKALKTEMNEETFSAPLTLTPILAGNFGELRSNHFHAGLDLKTLHKEGFKIRSIADGYVSRIKISHWGYGKAIYIRHKNGLSSVYAHLQKFSPEIEAYVKDRQYKKQSYTIQLFPKAGELQVFKDSTIAYSGNTGGSTAPHLHFEMRKAGTAVVLNPLSYHNEVKDLTAPQIQKLFVYPSTQGAHVNKNENKTQISLKKLANGHYTSDSVRIKGSVFFGVKSFDRQELAANKNGVYNYQLYKKDSLLTHINFSAFSFNETSYINTLIDYEHLIQNRERILLLSSAQSDQLSVIKSPKNAGIISLAPGEQATYTLILEDFHNNKTTVSIPVIGVSDTSVVKKTINKTPFPIYHKSPAHFKLSHARIFFPAKSFYKDQYLEIKEEDSSITVHNKEVPLHKSMTLSFEPKSSPRHEKSYIGYKLNKKQTIYSPTKKDNGWLSTKTKKLGTFTIEIDSISPSIQARNFKPKQNIKNYQYLSLTISDKQTGIKSYEAYLNKQWILMEYEPKKNTITHQISSRTPLEKENSLEVRVTDMLDNQSVYTTTLNWQ